jgi:hypothetical protein
MSAVRRDCRYRNGQRTESERIGVWPRVEPRCEAKLSDGEKGHRHKAGGTSAEA